MLQCSTEETSVQIGEHREITATGWAYRTNDRGWMIYRDPRTGLWHTASDALAIIRSVQGEIREKPAVQEGYEIIVSRR